MKRSGKLCVGEGLLEDEARQTDWLGQVLEIWTPADHTPRIEREHLTWDPAGASATFDLSLAQLFRPV